MQFWNSLLCLQEQLHITRRLTLCRNVRRRLIMNNLICLFLGFIEADEQFLPMYHFPCVCFLGFPGSVGCTEVCGKRWQLVAGDPGLIRHALRHKGLAKLSFSLSPHGWKCGKAVDCGLCSLLQLLVWIGGCSPGIAAETPG